MVMLGSFRETDNELRNRTSRFGSREKTSWMPGFMVEEHREEYVDEDRFEAGWVVLSRSNRWIGLGAWRAGRRDGPTAVDRTRVETSSLQLAKGDGPRR